MLAELAARQPRPELRHILKHAIGGKIEISSIEKGLNVTARSATNLIKECQYLGLVDKGLAITPAGNEYLRRGDGVVHVPEQGCYIMVVGGHLSFGQAVLDVERTLDEPEEHQLRVDHDIELDVNVPLLGDARNFVYRRDLDAKRRVAMLAADDWSCELSLECGLNKSDQAQGSIRWDGGRKNAGRDTLRLRTDIESLWQQVLSAIPAEEGKWATAPTPHLAIRFQDASAEERVGFTRFKISLAGPHVIGSSGESWDEASLVDVPVGPADAKEAQRWAYDLFLSAIVDGLCYAGSHDAETLHRHITASNPVMKALAPRYDSATAIKAASTHDSRRCYWALQAAQDLGGERSPEATLLVRGDEEMSLVEFLGKLTGSLPAKSRFILYDKFALRRPNVGNVTAFHEACRELSKDSHLTLLTLPKSPHQVTDPKPSAQGISHRNALEFFGRGKLPHDRFLLIVSERTAEAWQLSNSPLAATSRDHSSANARSMLRWDALLAFKRPLDSLEDGFQKLLQP